MQVIAIDPAPKKDSTVFDGAAFLEMDAPQLRRFLQAPEHQIPETLVCWDAPLTGPRHPETAGRIAGDFSQRRIEQFFSRQETGHKACPGISVRPYSQCPHWTITRSVFSLPRTGPYDNRYEHLPFPLLPGAGDEAVGRPCIVEIHPAVAAWLWCRRTDRFESWKYKEDDQIWKEMWRIILSQTGFDWGERPHPQTDDEFDAAVGYLLGTMYVRDESNGKSGRNVVILGNRETGSFLLPAVPGLWEEWRRFVGS